MIFVVLGVAVEGRRLTQFLRHHRWLVTTTTTTHSAIGIFLKIMTAIEDVLRHSNRHGDAEQYSPNDYGVAITTGSLRTAKRSQRGY